VSYSAAPSGVWQQQAHFIGTQAAGGQWSSMIVDGAAGEGAWPTADRAIYQPIRVPIRCIVRKLYVATGGTGTGNFDIGLYNLSGSRLVSSGSTAHPATYTVTVADVTDTTIGPGTYWIAVACSNNTDTFYYSTPAAPMATALGVLTQTSAMALPATATFSITQSLAVLPVCGLFLTTLES